MNKVELFVPGRIEILGNHTDHQNGKVICSPITLGNKVKAEANGTDFIVIESADYGIIKINIKTLQLIENNMPKNSEKMVIGILKELLERKYCIDGATIKIESTLPVGIGLGSSAAFCLSIVCSLDSLFDFKIDKLEKAKLCQSVENKYIGKESGLMDQIACLSDGPIKIDFKELDKPIITELNINFDKYGYNICIIKSENSHDNFSSEYSEIKNEMQKVARYFSKNNLREIKKSELLENITLIRKSISDRAFLRSYHYFTENDRVDSFEKELSKTPNNIDKLLAIINESGNSSQTILQNYYSLNSGDRSLNIINIILKELRICLYGVKVCGGGFGGSCILFMHNTDLYILEQCFKENMLLVSLSNRIV